MRRLASLLLPLALAAGLPAAAQDRFAVVIGAESYPAVIGPAQGVLADAAHVAEALQDERFEVELIEDPDEAALKRSVFWLVDNLDRAGEDAVGVFYFAGAGVQINGDTYLLPIDARTTDDLTLIGSVLAGELVTERLEAVDGAAVLIVLDAASPNGLISRFDLEPGLASIDRPDNGLVIFSDAPGQVALPRQGGLSVFARAFADLVHSDERDFGDALQAFRRDVSEESGGTRYAWISGRLSSRFSLRRPEEDAPPDDAETTPEGDGALQAPDAPTPMPAPRDHSTEADPAGG